MNGSVLQAVNHCFQKPCRGERGVLGGKMKEIIHKMFVASLTEKVLVDRPQSLGRRGHSDNGGHPSYSHLAGSHLSPEKMHDSMAGSHEDHVERAEKWEQATETHKRRNEKNPRLSSTFSTWNS